MFLAVRSISLPFCLSGIYFYISQDCNLRLLHSDTKHYKSSSNKNHVGYQCHDHFSTVVSILMIVTSCSNIFILFSLIYSFRRNLIFRYSHRLIFLTESLTGLQKCNQFNNIKKLYQIRNKTNFYLWLIIIQSEIGRGGFYIL